MEFFRSLAGVNEWKIYYLAKKLGQGFLFPRGKFLGFFGILGLFGIFGIYQDLSGFLGFFGIFDIIFLGF